MNKITTAFALFFLLMTTHCAPKTTPAPALPRDILGISIGMRKEDAEKSLREIGKHQRDEPKKQEIWSLNSEPHFGYLVVGYDEDDKIGNVTALAKPKGGQPVRFADFGDIDKAKQEIAGSFHRYTWEVPAHDDYPAYFIIVEGKEAEVLSLVTLTDSLTFKEEDKEKENESGERE